MDVLSGKRAVSPPVKQFGKQLECFTEPCPNEFTNKWRVEF